MEIQSDTCTQRPGKYKDCRLEEWYLKQGTFWAMIFDLRVYLLSRAIAMHG